MSEHLRSTPVGTGYMVKSFKVPTALLAPGVDPLNNRNYWEADGLLNAFQKHWQNGEACINSEDGR